jgi:hypothetical protein
VGIVPPERPWRQDPPWCCNDRGSWAPHCLPCMVFVHKCISPVVELSQK